MLINFGRLVELINKAEKPLQNFNINGYLPAMQPQILRSKNNLSKSRAVWYSKIIHASIKLIQYTFIGLPRAELRKPT